MAERNVGECESRIHAELAQIDLRDGDIGAWQFIDRDRALARARQLDQSAIRGLLHGMSVGVKDIIDVAGMPTECGTPIYAGNIAKRDAACVELVKAAGAIIIGKTATTELAANHPAKTRNPLNPRTHAGWLFVWFRCCCGRGNGSIGVRYADGGIAPSPGVLLWCCGVQTYFRAGAAGRRQSAI